MTQPGSEAPLLGKWCALSPAETSEVASHLLSEKGAVLTTETQESVAGYLFTKRRELMDILFPPSEDRELPPVERRYPFTLTFCADNGGTRMHGNGEGRGLATLVWVADQIVAAAPGPPAT
jgi:hypothetical protein